MPNRTAQRIEFGRVGRRVIEANFDGGDLSSDGGLMLLRRVDERIVSRGTQFSPLVGIEFSPPG